MWPWARSVCCVLCVCRQADGCIRQLLRHVRVPPLLPPILAGAVARDAAPPLRTRCCQYLELILKSYEARAIDDEMTNQLEITLTKVQLPPSSARSSPPLSHCPLSARAPRRRSVTAPSQRALLAAAQPLPPLSCCCCHSAAAASPLPPLRCRLSTLWG